ncbi:hypothetical protein TNCV_3045521 [Trichonephila clavipes]|nr:hypothetical protein TNCV_3045521 [Trichonephila clavipes]
MHFVIERLFYEENREMFKVPGKSSLHRKNRSIEVRYKEISNNDIQFSIDVERVIKVENPQPGSVKVFDYYAPENSATTSYSFQNSTLTTSSTREA